ncbi:MAG: 50S ribosomal protein L10 [Tenericutes bacterium ADurb.BinA155]|jgi:large subunit ribosomal protein L10|nr:MAG: 50S ribosomal protein L10 [Tenericutes bacterium ADurb.BinA155]
MNQQVLEAKKKAVVEIDNGLKNSETVAVVSYQGLTVAELQELRRALADVDASFGVYKNTLVNRALKECNQPDLSDLLNGPNGFVFSKDVSKGPKALVKFSRYHEKLVLKGGLIGGKKASAEEIVTVSKLPDKNGLISMFLSCLQAPVRNFAYAVSKIAEKKPAAAAPAPAANAAAPAAPAAN